MLTLNNVNVRKFRLSEQFINKYKEAEVPWGPVGYVRQDKVSEWLVRFLAFKKKADCVKDAWFGLVA